MSTNNRIFDVVQAMSGQKNVIVIPRPYLKFFGSDQQAFPLAALLNQIVFWSGVDSSCGDGWFYKSHREMGADLEVLSEDQVLRLVGKIEKKYLAGIIETKSQKVNGTPTTHYRIIDSDALISKIFPPAMDSAKARNGKREAVESESQKCGMETAEPRKQCREVAESYLYTDLDADRDSQINKPSCQLAGPADGEEFISKKLTREATEVLQHLTNLTGVKFEPTDGNLQHIRARLRNETATKQDAMVVIEHLVGCWMGTKYSKGLNPGRIFSSDKFSSNLIAAKAWESAGRPDCKSTTPAIDIAGREEAYTNLIQLRRKPANRLEEIAKELAGKASFPGRLGEVAARATWRGIWSQAVAQASEEDSARIAS
ncbi:conserved phage C-terminal domain-containing protein [Klebsiella sp. BIGb0407]|uniref:conserved phage C-terminal domain-containing protein n=1 Tax=Klebsiella sp. BIGb0407 TaxID=2940603 RepID=UPI00216944B5|nr:conserved phage C-terminal domain-containing protein [Klebsiella sp. BIGb0407]MCS3433679.1 putative phage protein (TIGR02220 family) [Klebsiella sp. BIGb0407]